jgi:hypothetical protein
MSHAPSLDPYRRIRTIRAARPAIAVRAALLPKRHEAQIIRDPDPKVGGHRRRRSTVRQIKLFKGVERELGDLEKQVNDWLVNNDAKVVNIFGNISPQTMRDQARTGDPGGSFAGSDILLVVVYEQ